MRVVSWTAVLFVTLLRLGPAQDRAEIGLTLINTTQKYCQGDEDVGVLQVSGQFRYQNISTRPTLLLRHSHDIEYIRLRPEPPIPTQKPEYTVSSTTVLESLNSTSHLTANDFVRLGPNESYSEQKSFSFPFQLPQQNLWVDSGSGSRPKL